MTCSGRPRPRCRPTTPRRVTRPANGPAPDLAGLNDGKGVRGVVDEPDMDRLFSLGLDPVNERALGKNWPVHKTATQRIELRVAALPPLPAADRAAAVAAIGVEEHGRRTPVAVSGFDLTFTVPKSVSVLWALADPATQTRIATAHAEAVDDCLELLETHALFTRIGSGGAAQVPVRGAVAAGFDHWDTRTGDPNLHTHLVSRTRCKAWTVYGAASTRKPFTPPRLRSARSTTA